ncbi:MAG: 2-methylcitrate dehydratase [Betaproteobacteria bacterium]|nr:2-methylcitrate dehydratase [Betaproteobacteria bacterium]
MRNSSATVAESLAAFVATLDPAAIPAEVRDKARLHLLDSIGIAYAASPLDYARKACAGLAALDSGEYAVIGMPHKLALRDSVLMNGMLIHGLEYDDTAIRGRIHPSAFGIPAALGAGAFARANGRELLTAYIVGMECAIRIGAATRGGFSPAGFNAVGVVGAFGSTLVAGRLLGLDAERLTMAQGIAYSTAAGNREFTAADSWTKRFEAGWPAASAITAAMLAKEGFIAPRTAYEGKFGVFNTYLNSPAAPADVAAITAGLGQTWEFSRTLIKLRPSCFFNHPVINATLAVVGAHALNPDDIVRIRALLPAAAIDTVCEPRAEKLAPRDIAAAQFSVYFSAACAAIKGRFTLGEMDLPTLKNPAIQALAAKVEYAVDPDSKFPAHYSGGVEIFMRDGRQLSAREDVNASSPEKPLPAAAIEEKFIANAQRAMPFEQACALRDRLLAIESCRDVRELALGFGANPTQHREPAAKNQIMRRN